MTSCIATATTLNLSTLASRANNLSILSVLALAGEFATFSMPAGQDAQDAQVLGAWRHRYYPNTMLAVCQCDALRRAISQLPQPLEPARSRVRPAGVPGRLPMRRRPTSRL